MSDENDLKDVFTSDIREFCENIFLKYSNYRLILKNTLDKYPAYELSKLYYDVANLWFECCKERGNLAVNMCKNYLKKCLDIFENHTIDICVKARLLLSQVYAIINEKANEIGNLEEELRNGQDSNEDFSTNDFVIESTLKLAGNYLTIGDFKRANDYLKFYASIIDENEVEISKYSEQFIDLTLFLEVAEIVESKLELQESLMFIEPDDHTEIEFSLTDTKHELQNTLKLWRENCEQIKINTCTIRFIESDDEHDDVNVDDVLSGKEILIFKNNKNFSIGFVRKSTKEFERAEINDKLILEVVRATHKNLISNVLINRVNRLLAKIDSEYFLTKIIKNRLIVLTNKEEFSFYLYVWFHDRGQCKIIGDVVNPSNENISKNQLWSYLFRIFTGEFTLNPYEFLHKLLNENAELFFGNLKNQLPLLRSERFANVYVRLAAVYEYLGHAPLANEYKRKITVIKNEPEMETGLIKNDLMVRQILMADSALTLPGDYYLNKHIDENEFFTKIVPKLDEIKEFQKFLNPCLSLIVIGVNFIPETSNWFDNDVYTDMYQNEQQKIGSLVMVCFLIYFNQNNSWGVMFKIGETKFSGMLTELTKTEDYKRELQAMVALLVDLTNEIDIMKVTNDGEQAANEVVENVETEEVEQSAGEMVENVEEQKEDEEERTQDEACIRKIYAKSKKFVTSICEAEKILNIFMQKHFLNKNIAINNVISKSDKDSDVNTSQKIHDITTVDGIIRLKKEINAARKGYFVILRKENDFNDSLISEKDNQLAHLINVNDNYYIYSKDLYNEWSLKDISSSTQQSNLILLKKGFFENLSVGAENKIFVSPMQNEFLFHFIEHSYGINLNSTTKTVKEDVYFSLLKVDVNHYIALGITRYNESNDYMIYLADPLNSCFDFVSFLDITGKNFKYCFNPQLSFIFCPDDDNSTCKDTLIKAYINLKVMQSTWNKGKEDWEFFISYFKYQVISSSKNIESIRKWYEKENTLDDNKLTFKDFLKSKKENSNESLNTNILELFLKFDSTFQCSYSIESKEENSNDDNKLKQALLKAHKSIKLINSIEKFTFDNAVVHNVVQNFKSIDYNMFHNWGKDDLINIIRSIITRRQHKIPNNLFESLTSELNDIASSEPDNRLKEIIEFLSEMLYTEKYDVILEIINECQYQLNGFFKRLFDEFIENVFFSESTQTCQLFIILKEFYDSNFASSFDFIKLSSFIKDKLDVKTELNELCKDWSKLESIIMFNDVKSSEMAQFIKNNTDSINCKVSFVSSIINHIKHFISTFAESLVNQYGTLELQEVYKLIFDNVEYKLVEDVNFIKEMPANNEANEVIERIENVFNENENKILLNEAIRQLVYSLALNLSKRIPKYIAKYRQICAEYFETLYETMHDLFIKDLNVFIAGIEVQLSTKNNIVSKCIEPFNEANKSKSDTLTNVIMQLNSSKFNELIRLLPQMEINKCNTFIYLNNYYPLIETLVRSFEKMNTVVVLLKEDLLKVLVKKFNTVTDESLMSVLKSQILDKINANTELNKILSSLDNFNFTTTTAIDELQDTFESRNDLKAKYACSYFLKQFILDLIDKYMQSFLAFRERSKNLFNSTETFLANILSSFYLLSNRSAFKCELRDILTAILKNEHDYSNFCEIYVDVLKKVSNWPHEAVKIEHKTCFENLIKTFSNPLGHSHFAYFECHFKTLKNLLENFLNPYEVKVKKDNSNRATVSVTVRSGLLSEILKLIKTSLERPLEPGDELRIISSEKVFIDVDMNDQDAYSGVNVILVGIDYELAPSKESFTICVNGINAKQHVSGQAKNGMNASATYNSRNLVNGGNGADGMNGLPGGHAGNIFLFANKVPDPSKIYVLLSGGNGGHAQIGGY